MRIPWNKPLVSPIFAAYDEAVPKLANDFCSYQRKAGVALSQRVRRKMNLAIEASDREMRFTRDNGSREDVERGLTVGENSAIR
ncbi:MAG: hypothetical protein KF708_11370 [Pirellulales bacterium]|nr:hypothetical protein [Pirellulales bacterium]